ncbi:hypothetical protein B0J14DRAFT_489225 [Halenospora varia]|nr:hypothetical protein B0J14DRAFT_489225 [Halenospora varia]
MNRENLTLTLPGCEQMCGHQTWYWDLGPRISTWLVPILLLVSNVDLSPLDKRRFMAIIHLVGDPIDSFWSLIHKLDAWEQCYKLAGRWENESERRRRIIANVFAAFEEIEGPEIFSEDYWNTLAERSGLTHDDTFVEWTRTAIELADSRSDEFLRTWLAIILYIWQVVASFVPEIGGGNTSPPGGRIGTAMFISWLVPAVLLSNALGSFTSRRSCYNIIHRFAERTKNVGPPLRRRSSQFRGKVIPGSATDMFEALAWTGGIYTFRPWKFQYITCERNVKKTLCIGILATVPVCIAMIGGFVIIWYTLPNGFNCRHFWLIAIFTAWYFSAFITWYSNASRFVTGKYHWRFVLVKDALIAIPSVIVIFLSSAGLFNSCFCWSGYFQYGAAGARILLNSAPFYDFNDRTLYPGVVSVCLLAQICYFIFVAIRWRNGLHLIRWAESVRHEEAEWVRNMDMEKARREDSEMKSH